MDTYLITHYKGKYRVFAEIDDDIGDFPRDEDGNIDDSFGDFYLETTDGDRIRHGCRDVLSYFTTSVTRGNHILKALYKEKIKDGSIKLKKDEKALTKIDDIAESLMANDICGFCDLLDGEIFFSFKAKDLPLIAKMVKIKTKGAKISPTSPRSLPQQKYEIPEADLLKYKEATKGMEGLLIARYQKEFGNTLVKDFDGVLEKNRLKANQYFHKTKKWAKWLKFLESKKTQELEKAPAKRKKKKQ